MIVKLTDLNSFLYTVAGHVLENYGSRIKDLHFIFPNRRAVQVFKNHLISLSKGPVWTPKMSSIDDWMTELSGLVEAEKICQLLNLYVSVGKETKQAESLDNFVRWGEMLLRDYDEIDKYLVPANKIFSTIKGLKEIETRFPSLSPEQMAQLHKFWEGFHPTPSSYQENWLSLWQSLSDIYIDFHKRLGSLGLSTSGHIYRYSAEKISKYPGECLPMEKYLFVGFNALTAAEDRVFEVCKRESKAEFFWDIPSNLQESYQESGRFIRDNVRKYPPTASFSKAVKSLHDRFSESFPTNFFGIDIYACESASGQVGLLRQLLEEGGDLQFKGISDKQKAVILADETLLEPVLSAISDPETAINISMGLPAERSLIVDFFNRIIGLNSFLSLRKTGKVFVPAKEMAQLVAHPMMLLIMGREFIDSLSFVKDWPTEMLPIDLMLAKQEDLDSVLCYEDQSEFTDTLISILIKFEEVHDPASTLESESLKKISSWMLGLQRELKQNSQKISFETFRSLYKEFIQTARLSFEGSLDAGIQLTGILETRLMDYDELIILSCNEGVWPADSSPPSMIPFSLRKAYHLPTREFRDSFYGYYFYRLLQRARKVSLMYVNSPDPARMSQGEPSRFIQQLRYDSNQFCNEFLAASTFNIEAPHSRTIQKTGEVYKSLIKYLDSGRGRMLSPSAINSYIDCPLRFALQYLLKMREGDDLVEAGEPRMFGLLMHKSLELFYEGFLSNGSIVSKGFLEEAIKDRELMEAYIRRAFMAEYFKIEESAEWPELYGKDLLVYDVISKQMKSVLLYDVRYAPFTIKGLERKITQSFEFKVQGEVKKVLLGGIVDRMDQKGGVLRVLDYKSGNPDMKFKDVEDLFDYTLKKRSKEILQASIYSVLILRELDEGVSVKPVIYPTGKMRSKLFDPGVKHDKEFLDDIKSIEGALMSGLEGVLSEMFNPDIPFGQTDNEGNCEWCSFKDYCNR